MPNWNQILDEIRAAGSMHDVIRRRYLAKVHEVTRRNVIIYYSGWLQKGGVPGVDINDEDKNGFMTVVHGMDKNLGLDLILHTPGGEIAATESLVDYLRSVFGTDIRAIVPQLAMSGGTVVACACREIVMGKQSSLGPIDPQFAGIPAHGIVEEFNRAKKEVREDTATIPIWQPIIAKYSPALIGECEKALAWSEEMTRELLRTCMFQGDDRDCNPIIEQIVTELGDHALTKSHARHLSAQRCQEIGLKIVDLEQDQMLQDAVLSLHHTCMLTFSSTTAVKIIENHKGTAFIKMAHQVVIAGQPMSNHGMKEESGERPAAYE